MNAAVLVLLEWTPLVCWLVALICFMAMPSRLVLLGPLTKPLRRRALAGTFFFFLGLLFFLLQMIVKWFTQGHSL